MCDAATVEIGAGMPPACFLAACGGERRTPTRWRPGAARVTDTVQRRPTAAPATAQRRHRRDRAARSARHRRTPAPAPAPPAAPSQPRRRSPARSPRRLRSPRRQRPRSRRPQQPAPQEPAASGATLGRRGAQPAPRRLPSGAQGYRVAGGLRRLEAVQPELRPLSRRGRAGHDDRPAPHRVAQARWTRSIPRSSSCRPCAPAGPRRACRPGARWAWTWTRSTQIYEYVKGRSDGKIGPGPAGGETGGISIDDRYVWYSALALITAGGAEAQEAAGAGQAGGRRAQRARSTKAGGSTASTAPDVTGRTCSAIRSRRTCS